MEKTLIRFEKYLEDYYQKRLEELSSQLDEVKRVEEFLLELVEKNELVILMKEEGLEAWKKDNRYKTQVETGTGRTIGGKEARIQVVETLFNCKRSELSASDYPAYGMVCAKDKMRQFMTDSDPIYKFGEVIVSLKKDAVIERSTMTIGSSMDFGAFEYKRPCFLREPKISCLPGTNYDNISQSRYRSPLVLNKFNTALLDKKLSSSLPSTLVTAFDGILGFEFYEIQIHGTLLFDRDVEGVEIF